jgi:hypothetical protein
LKELTFLENWEDNSPSNIYESLYKPVPLKCQSGEVVFKTATDNSEFFTFYVLRDKTKFVTKTNRILNEEEYTIKNIWRKIQSSSGSASNARNESFDIFYLKGDYTDCFVNSNIVVFWGRPNNQSPLISPRFVYFGSQGAVGFYLDDLKPNFNAEQLKDQEKKELEFRSFK